MPETIFFRVGSEDRIQLADFIEALKKFLGILRDLDSAISEEPSSHIRWEVAVLQKNSPPLVGITPTPRRLHVPGLSEQIEAQLIENTRSLTYRGQRNKFMPDSALQKMKSIAIKSERIGPMAIYVGAEGVGELRTEINSVTLGRVRELTDPKFEGFGSIVGSLDSISVHKGNEFRVWDKSTGKPVRCLFRPVDLDRVKELLKKTMIASGIVHSNSAGVPIAMDVEELQLVNAAEVPKLEDIAGLVEDFTEGKSLKAYMEELSDE